MARYNAALHPRDARGRFKPKLSQSVRVSPVSVSYNAGARIPIVPGRANLYVGALVRVERAGGNQFLKKQTDRAVNAFAGRLGDAGGRSLVAQVLKGNKVNVRGLNVQGPKNVINAPTFRVSSTPNSRTSHSVRRAPRVRNVRSPHVARTPGISSSVKRVGTATPRRLRQGDLAGRRRTRKPRQRRAAR